MTPPPVRRKNADAENRSWSPAPVVAPGSPEKYRARVRMYRQGLGDCFLITIPKADEAPFHILIDCGVLRGDRQSMTRIVEHIRDTVRDGRPQERARLDVVVATHEHKDHLSGFNQARQVFTNDFDFGAVWLGWTENLTISEIKSIKEAKRKTTEKLRAALSSPFAAAAGVAFDGVQELLGFSADDDSPGARTVADALEYLKLRGKDAGGLRYLEPGEGPIRLDGLPGVKVYVLGPPRDPRMLKASEVTQEARDEGLIYHLASTGEVGVDALCTALSSIGPAPEVNGDRYHPFSPEHRIAETVSDPLSPGSTKLNPYFDSIRDFVDDTYRHPDNNWRRIDHDWLGAFEQLALDLDSDTNNTSLVLAFEFEETEEVLLFVGDAQVGNWRSWAKIEFTVPGREQPIPASDLLRRTVFYKVGHHASHNATLKKGGLELMTSDDLVAFVPLDLATAASMGKKDPVTGQPKGWAMPAPPLYKALLERCAQRVVIADATKSIPPEARQHGVVATNMYIDYFLT